MIFNKLTVRDVPIDGKTVLLRTGFDVPIDDGRVRDDFRILAGLETIEYLLERRCRVVILSHLGRPKGQREDKFSMRPVAQRLANLLQREVRFVDDCVGEKVREAVRRTPLSSAIVLENVRFYAEEKANDEEFARQMAVDSDAAYFVQDGFAVVHRAHASTDAITHYLPPVAGLLLEREFLALTSAIESPERPMVAVMGGAKVSDKLDIMKRLISRADQVLVGGAMANTFINNQGLHVGKSVHERDMSEVIGQVYDAVRQKVPDEQIDNFLRLPFDAAVGGSTDPQEERREIDIREIAESDMILDIGSATLESYQEVLRSAGTVIWNGPMGYTESPAFRRGSEGIAETLISESRAVTIIGGGDTADFIRSWDPGKGQRFTHVSTGGGASMELMAGAVLPGIEALLDAHQKIS